MVDDEYFKNEDYSIFKSILGLVSFSTILPIKVHTSINHMARVTWVWPFIHLIIGFLAAAIAYISLNFLHFNSFLTAIFVFAFLIIINGFNHIDGVMDMADGLMVHGTSEKRISVMKDSMVGAGGISAAILVSLITIASFNNLLDFNFIIGIVVVEMLSKTSLITTALVSKPLATGIGRYFIESINIINFIISTVLVGCISFLLCGFVGIFSLIGAVLAGAIVAFISKRNFTFANGDVLGSSNEIGRVFAILFMIIALVYLM